VSGVVDPDFALAAIAARQPIDLPALLLVAHSDDEVLGCSVAMRHLPQLRLVHATDGSGGDQRVATQRLQEVMAATKELGLTPSMAPCGLPDGALIEHAGALASALAAWMPDTALLITHAFEGGHPDHDACALAGQLACLQEFARSGRRVARLEFAIYSGWGGAIRTNAFPRDATPAPTVLTLSPEEKMRKHRALQAFASQRHVVERFPLDSEAIRPAPDHDFAAPRDPNGLLFAFQNPEREPEWRHAAVAALAS
jgi:LmbE family N-acetylglucosaminyl deacetylase